MLHNTSWQQVESGQCNKWESISRGGEKVSTLKICRNDNCSLNFLSVDLFFCVCTHYIFVYMNIVNAVFTCLSGWSTMERGQDLLNMLFVKRDLVPGFHKFLPFYSKRLQPTLTILSTSLIKLNKCYKCKTKFVLPCFGILMRMCVIELICPSNWQCTLKSSVKLNIRSC